MDYTLLKTELNDDIDFANDYIAESFKDIEVLNSTNLIVSRENISPTAIKMANIVTASVYKRQFGITLAIEDNDQNNKGFIDRIIDAIKRAINWIVDKIKQFWNWLTGNKKTTEENKKRINSAPDIKFTIKDNVAYVDDINNKQDETFKEWFQKMQARDKKFQETKTEINETIIIAEKYDKNKEEKAKEITELLKKKHLQNKHTDEVIDAIVKDPKKDFNSHTALLLTYNPDTVKLEIPLPEIPFSEDFIYSVCKLSTLYDVNMRSVHKAVYRAELAMEVIDQLTTDIYQIIKNGTLAKIYNEYRNILTADLTEQDLNKSSLLFDKLSTELTSVGQSIKVPDRLEYSDSKTEELKNCKFMALGVGKKVLCIPDKLTDLPIGSHIEYNMKTYETFKAWGNIARHVLLDDMMTKGITMSSQVYFTDTTTKNIRDNYDIYQQIKHRIEVMSLNITDITEKILKYLQQILSLSKGKDSEIIVDLYHTVRSLVSYIMGLITANIKLQSFVSVDCEIFYKHITKALL